jgi:peptidoglycan/xylan/chitin deacetylase (PgdA/CDA1 family)
VALPTVCCSRQTGEPVVALTFDDGPHPEVTDAILEVLARHEARATFFLIGDRVTGNEGVVARIVDEGHELGDHMMHDEPSILLSRNRFREHLTEARDLLTNYQDVSWWRPGSGWTTRGHHRWATAGSGFVA